MKILALRTEHSWPLVRILVYTNQIRNPFTNLWCLVNCVGVEQTLVSNEYRLSETDNVGHKKTISTTGSTADGVADLDQFKYNGDVRAIAKGISKAAEELQDEDKKSSSSSSSEDEDEARK